MYIVTVMLTEVLHNYLLITYTINLMLNGVCIITCTIQLISTNCLLFPCAFYKAASPLKSGILLFALVHQR
jgi:hypothetical protein